MIRRRLLAAVLTLLLVSCGSTFRPFMGVAEPALPPAKGPPWDHLVSLRSDDWFSLLDHGPKSYGWRLRAIDSATSSIDLQSFLVGHDDFGSEVFRRLLLAADRGVRVRILLDDSFLQETDPVVHAIDSHPNIEFRVYNPYSRRSGGGATRFLLNLGDFSRINHRMHNKLLVVDGRVAIVGGRNLADEYFGFDPAMNFRDLEILGGGPHVRRLSRAFDEYWNDHWAIPAELLPSDGRLPLSLADYRRQLKRPRSAPAVESVETRHRAWRTVCQSAVSGEPRLLLDEPPHKNPALRSEAPVQVAHQVSELLDEEHVFIGSTNLDARSLRINTEMGLVVESPELNRQLRETIRVDFHPRNSWKVELHENGSLRWIAGKDVRKAPPAASRMQRFEDWLFALLPIESQM